KDRMMARMKELGLKPSAFVDKDLGYELRCADPIPFDAEYTRDLGYGAVKFLRSPKAREYGAIISDEAGRLKPLPFQQMIDPETKRMRPRKADVRGEVYEVARRYMIRLEPSDFEEPELAYVAAATGLSPEQFSKQFGYL